MSQCPDRLRAMPSAHAVPAGPPPGCRRLLRWLRCGWMLCALVMPAGAWEDDSGAVATSESSGVTASRPTSNPPASENSRDSRHCKNTPQPTDCDGSAEPADEDPQSAGRRPAVVPQDGSSAQDRLQPLPPRLVLRKDLGGQRVRASDQFTVSLLSGMQVIASATTSGTAGAVQDGNTGTWKLVAGTQYTLAEAMAPGSESTLAQYDTWVICKNRRPQGTNMKNITVLGEAFVLKRGDDIDCKIRNTPKPPQLTVRVRSMGRVGVFSFHGSSNADQMNLKDGYVIQTEAEGAWYSGRQVALRPAGVRVEIEQRTPPGWRIMEAQCTDANAAITGNPEGYFGGLVGDTLEIARIYLQPAADLRCSFTNVEHIPDVSGKVFLDVGGDLGVAHDGQQSVTEIGHSGVLLHLSDCNTRVFSQALTRSDGSFSLNAAEVADGQQVCVQQQLPGGYRGVSVDAGTTRAASQNADPILRFKYAAGVTYSGLLFGNAPVGSLSGGGTKTVTAGAGVLYVHIYTAGSSGNVSFEVERVDAGADPDWRQTAYLDALCDGVTTSDSRPSQGSVEVTAGQKLCVLVHVESPAHAVAGTTYRTRLRARETWATPTLGQDVRSANLETIDVSRVAPLGLTLRKAWRGVAQCPSDAATALADQTPFAMTGQITPGQRIEYRVTYSNQTDGPLHDITVLDAVPAYMVFEQAFCAALPARGIDSCTVAEQPAVGSARGVVRWAMTDANTAATGLQPQDVGSVGYCLRLQQ